jgi:hypothetical protein
MFFLEQSLLEKIIHLLQPFGFFVSYVNAALEKKLYFCGVNIETLCRNSQGIR